MENKHILFILKNANPKLRKSILKNCSLSAIKSIQEIAHNVLNGNHKVSPPCYNALKRYKRELRNFTCSNSSQCAKRKIVVQRGGFVPLLISSVLSGIIGKILSSS